MTLPTDFASFASGWDFTEDNYSTPGVGGGSFANLVSGQQAVVAGSSTPSFTTKSANNVEGWVFDGTSNSRLSFDWIYGTSTTLLLIGSFPSTAYQHLFGCAETGTTRWSMYTSSNKIANAFNNFAVTCTTANNITAGTPFVATLGWSKKTWKGYIQLNDGTTAEVVNPTINGGFLTHWLAIFGGSQTANAVSGAWLARALIFNRCLFVDDNTNLQSLIDTEMASIGL